MAKNTFYGATVPVAEVNKFFGTSDFDRFVLQVVNRDSDKDGGYYLVIYAVAKAGDTMNYDKPITIVDRPDLKYKGNKKINFANVTLTDDKLKGFFPGGKATHDLDLCPQESYYTNFIAYTLTTFHELKAERVDETLDPSPPAPFY